MVEQVGLVAATVLPFFNIPMIMKIRQRRSSKDVSLLWTIGVWVCFLLMLPSGLQSDDKVFRLFTIMNITLFTAVVFFVLRYRK